ncbi:hypothetical protein HCN44_002568 [Aphidius gifuensis]|uniref:UDP-glucuronosyltransferase n=1 Tax=Aphidius gifuensis TaxID=684658 RepID=A0A834Y521_APHGI|nr:UDP-glucosyltransferase 2-like [Aphidius gifuensis]KAF7996922.1 hypothetical protein HCN44_002568 [Aphidius gifuensis]
MIINKKHNYLSINIIFLLLLIFVELCYANDDLLNTKISNKKYRILGVFGHYGKSHFDVFKPLLEELANRGHDLTVISYFPRDNNSELLKNYKDIGLAGPDDKFLNIVDVKDIKHSPLTPILEVLYLNQLSAKSCTTTFKNKNVQKLIKSRDVKFDIVITETFNTDCHVAFSSHFNAPLIGISTHVLMPWTSSRMINPDNPSYVPSILTEYSTNMNFHQRMINSLIFVLSNFIYDTITTWKIQDIVDDAFGHDIGRLSDIAANTSAILVNTHYSLHGAKPDNPNIIEIGGIHIKPQNLPNDLKKILDNANEGVLYFSLGSMIKSSSMNNETLKEIFEVLGNIPQKVIWKFETDRFDWIPPNFIIRKWLPQSAILHHPNTKGYLGHGGLLGMNEGISGGVPMCLVPFYGDQFVNSAAAKKRGIAEIIEWKNLNAKTLKLAIDKIFNDTSYYENAKKLQKAWHDRPMTPLETAVWWVEFIARGNGNEYLKTSASSLNWYQRYLIDVGIVIIAITFFIISIMYYLLKILLRIFKYLLSSNAHDVKKTN